MVEVVSRPPARGITTRSKAANSTLEEPLRLRHIKRPANLGNPKPKRLAVRPSLDVDPCANTVEVPGVLWLFAGLGWVGAPPHPDRARLDFVPVLYLATRSRIDSLFGVHLSLLINQLAGPWTLPIRAFAPQSWHHSLVPYSFSSIAIRKSRSPSSRLIVIVLGWASSYPHITTGCSTVYMPALSVSLRPHPSQSLVNSSFQ